ncbi:MAG: L-dopachrome tautomerase-related protein [Pseudomonadota bacterium]
MRTHALMLVTLLLAAPFSPAAADGPAGPLETVATFDADTPPGNAAITPGGRIFLSLHQFWGARHRVVELKADGSTVPYPSDAWAGAPEGTGPGLSSVLGIVADRRGRLWMLDVGGEGHAPKLVAWNTDAERLHRVIPLPAPATVPESFVNDLAVDLTHNAVYIADPAAPESAALIVVDLETGRARRVLAGSRFTAPEDINLKVDDRVLALGGAPARIGVNPIALSPDDATLYFGAMNGTKIYRIATRDLLDESLDDVALAARIAVHGPKPPSDGSTVDSAGNVYITSVNDDQVGVTTADGRYFTLYRQSDLSWPDGFAFGPDGQIYLTVNELHRSPVLGGGEPQGVMRLVRFPALAPGLPGR